MCDVNYFVFIKVMKLSIYTETHYHASMEVTTDQERRYNDK